MNFLRKKWLGHLQKGLNYKLSEKCFSNVKKIIEQIFWDNLKKKSFSDPCNPPKMKKKSYFWACREFFLYMLAFI